MIKYLLTKRIIFSLTAVCLISAELFSQSLPLDSSSDIYLFLRRIENKYPVEFNSISRPVSRSQVKNYLDLLDSSGILKENYEKENLSFYKNEFDAEDFSDSSVKKMEFINDGKGRVRLFSYKDKKFSFYVDPVFQLRYFSFNNTWKKLWSNGIEAYGYINNSIGYRLKFYDNHEDQYSFRDRKFTREQGIQQFSKTDYDQLLFNLSYGWSNGSITVGKDYFKIGSGIDGQVILSNKAPAFPFISLDYSPTDWLTFKYIHCWLNSDIADSGSYKALDNSTRYNYTIDRREKYLALHLITIKPIDRLFITIGESIVYSDKLEIAYLVPISFFRLADHFLSRGDTGDNAQMFADVKYLLRELNSCIYGTLFIDELQSNKILTGDNSGNKHIAYTTGINSSDLLIPNSEIVIEYTKVFPFAYNNFNPVQTYYSSGYQLGHWIGSNADQLHFSFTKGISRGIEFQISYDYIRKGKKETVDEQYTFPNPSFLYGTKSYLSRIYARVCYIPIHPVKINLEYMYNIKSTGRFTDEYGLNYKNYFSFSMSYGL